MGASSWTLSARAERRRPSMIRELMVYMDIDGMISLGGGYPNPSTFAFEALRLELTQESHDIEILGRDMIRASQYGPTLGTSSLLERLKQWHFYKDGVDLPEGGLMVTNGSQEGLYMLADILLEEEDAVVLSAPTYPGALIAFGSFTQNFITVPLDKEGLRVDLLEKVLSDRKRRGERQPKIIYTIPNGHNPAGVSLSAERRRALVDLAARHEIAIVEDDPYQLLRLAESPPESTLQSLAFDQVIRLDSFSKILCPGLRIGYVSGSPRILRAMALHKQASNLQTGSLVQALLEGYFQAEGYQGLSRRISRNAQFYRVNRDAMVSAARTYLPDEVHFEIPQSGMFIWFDLPEACDAMRMIENDCAELKVLLVPGIAFSYQEGFRNAMRASYAMVSPAEIEAGMQRFAEMIRRELGRR